MPLLYKDTKEVLFFIHIPKAAGTSLKSAFSSSVAMALNVEFKKELPCPPQHFHYELLSRLGVFNFCESSFVITRNPVARFVSEYTYRKRVDRKFKYMPLTIFTAFCFSAYKYNPYLLSNHIRPQNEFVGPFSEIFKLEDGLNKVFQHYPSFFDSLNEEGDKKNTSGSSRIAIDAMTLNLIQKFYKEDFDTLAYEKSDNKPTQSRSRLKYLLQVAIGNILGKAYGVLNNKRLKP